MHSKNNKKVALAMSGGIDSTIAVHLLKEMGYEVEGVHFRFWQWDEDYRKTDRSEEKLLEIRDTFNIPMKIINFENYFKKTVVKHLIDEQEKGRTPNPCVKCNPLVKFKLLKQFADETGSEYLSTGHYARIAYDEKLKKYLLMKGIDKIKDQSYVLCYLDQNTLSRTIFPLGDKYKKDIYKIRDSLGLKMEDVSESQDLCFVKPENYKDFLNKNTINLQKGKIVSTHGEILGEHCGLIHYTIGQRKGIKVSDRRPFYVLRKDMGRNELIIGHEEDLDVRSFEVAELNWIAETPAFTFESDVKIRYRSSLIPCKVQRIGNNQLVVKLKGSARGITPGQYAVFYSDEILLGGGKIVK